MKRLLLMNLFGFVCSFIMQAQSQETIRGQVRNAGGQAIANVTVQEKGASTGTSTNAEGNYILKLLKPGALITFSSVGYTTLEISSGGNPVLDVVLEAKVVGLEDVIVVGYGTTREKKLTTSVATINASKINNMPITNVADAFTGNVSGVLVQDAGGGTPGGQLPIIRIRGYGSINAGSEPMYVIDGVIASAAQVNLLNVKAIESVNILKDAAAGAIYGSRAGNGVVLITTKSGKGKTKFLYNSTVGIQKVEKRLDVLTGPEYVAFAKQAYAASGQPEPIFPQNIANTNWQNEIFQTGVFQNHEVSANGSTDKINYNVSVSYRGNNGTIITTYDNNYASNAKLDIKLTDKLKMGLSYVASYSKNRFSNKLLNGAHSGGGILEDVIIQYPVIPVYTENGDYGQQPGQDWGAPVAIGLYGNPVAGLKEVENYDRRLQVLGNAYISYEIIKGLTARFNLSGTASSIYSTRYESPYLGANGHNQFANFSNPRYESMVAAQSNSSNNSYIANGLINYTKTFFDVHHFGLDAGFSNEYEVFTSTAATAGVNDRGPNATNPLPAFDNDIRRNIWGANDLVGTGGFAEQAFSSLFSRLNYDYKDKYLLMASVRRDGSSKFAPKRRYGIFPAVSAAWRISEEEFMRSQGWINDLKLRLSYGVSGNDQIGNYSWQGGYSYGNQFYFGSLQTSTGPAILAYPTSIANPTLRWETNTQYNIGIDFSAFKNRIRLVTDYYVRNTKDVLLRRPLPGENGISSTILDNIGNISNRGFEIHLTTTNVSGKRFNWTTDWIFNRVWNTASRIYSPDGTLRLNSGAFNSVWIVQGQEMFQIYGYKVLGLFKTNEELQKLPNSANSRVGDPIILDADKNGSINANDFVKLGKALPDFTFGWTNTLSYKNLTLNIIIDGSYGASNYLPALRNQAWINPRQGNILRYIYDRVGTTYPVANLNYTGERVSPTSLYVFDASYVRVKNLTLGYNLPEGARKALNVQQLGVSFSVQNLHTFTSYPWYNVQANFYNGAAGSAQFGVDYGSYPSSTIFALGFNLTF